MKNNHLRGFVPYGAAALLIGVVGGFTAGLGPAFVQDIGIPYSNVTWMTLALAVSSAACAPVLGKLGDLLGRRTTLLLGVAVFALGNMLTAIASSLGFMLMARFIVGVGTAAVTPVILAYIVTEFPREDTARGFSLYMLISSSGVIFGPTLGGLLVAVAGWRTMMWLCAAISGGIFLFCLFWGRGEAERERSATGRFDLWGGALVLVFFGLVLCIPSFGQNFGWTSMPFLLVLAGAGLSLLGLAAAERRAENPVLQGSFMARRTFLLSVAALFLTQGLLQANMTNVIVFVNYTQPDNTLLSGYAISIMYLGMSLGSVLVGPQADRREPKRVLTVSFALTGLGCALLLLFSESTPFLLMALSLGLLGFGLGGNAAIFMKVVLDGLPPAQAGTGTGVYGLFRDLAAPFGVAVLVPLFTNRTAAEITAGAGEAAAAVTAIHTLAVVELGCVAAGMLLLQLLPTVRKNLNNNDNYY